MRLSKKVLSGFLFLSLAFTAIAFADDAAGSGSSVLDQAAAFLQPYLLLLVQKFPVALSVVAVMGVLRTVFKPLMTFLQALADATPTPVDNQLLASAEASKPYKVLAFILDYLASLKI